VDRWDLYERTVQAPELVVAMLRSIHGARPRVLGEDFCGSAALSRAWVAAITDGRAIAIDHDVRTLERARSACRDHAEAIELVLGDVVEAPDPVAHRADVIFAGNFSVGELGTRAELIAYLRRARARLAEGGVFVCDTYGGASAWRVGALERSSYLPDGARIRWLWEQRSAESTTAAVVDALHFRVERAGEIVLELRDAFVYRWRLWSFPELVDALLEAGFARAEVHADREVGEQGAASEGEVVIACVVGRAGGSRG
jgi:SAM-dependent methyltransferase